MKHKTPSNFTLFESIQNSFLNKVRAGEGTGASGGSGGLNPIQVGSGKPGG
ncbi:MAG: hypothetical protein AAFQ98_00230 [Bacteroidota bacterium]